MLAELAGRIGRYRDAESLLRRAIELSPGFTAARANLAIVLYRQNRPAEAIAELDLVMEEDPDNPGHANLKAAALGRIGGFDEAIELYEAVLKEAPHQPKVWMSYGHMLKTVGRQADGIAAYRRAIELMPELGEAWWSLANLKTVRFDDADIAAMQAALARGDISDEDRFHLDFALGKAFEDRKQAGARRSSIMPPATRCGGPRSSMTPTRPQAFVDRSDRAVHARISSRSARAPGCDAPDPIFILGMPRAGSTLVEQILSSHPLVEGTSELPDIPTLARRDRRLSRAASPILRRDKLARAGRGISRAHARPAPHRPAVLHRQAAQQLGASAVHPPDPAEREDHRCAAPSARLLLFQLQAAFRARPGVQLRPDDMGRYYRDYVRLMAHVDAVLPGRVHRVIYERMVDDTEARGARVACRLRARFRIRPASNSTRPSARCAPPAPNRCASRYSAKAPRLGSRSSRGLDPLKTALGDVLDSYPAVPAFT